MDEDDWTGRSTIVAFKSHERSSQRRVFGELKKSLAFNLKRWSDAQLVAHYLSGSLLPSPIPLTP